MNRASFLERLRQELNGMAPAQVEEIVADYDAHFAEAKAAGRDEEEVATALGDPSRLAKELRAEEGLRRWETRPSAGNFLGVVFALLGLATVDLLFLLPLLLVIGVVVFAIGLALVIVAIVGIAFVVSLALWSDFASIYDAMARALHGIGLLAGAVGSTALLLLILRGFAGLLARYVRLHYRLLHPAASAA